MPLELATPIGAEMVVEGRRLINFGGSSYLGLSGHQQIVSAGVRALQEGGAGYQFARSYDVVSHWHLDAEDTIAEFFDTEDAQLLPNGYAFGLIALSAIAPDSSTVFYDSWSHMALKDGIRASGCDAYQFEHLDADDLRRQLQTRLKGSRKPIIITDGLYSTFGEIPPIPDFLSEIADYDGHLIIDESHSYGVLGECGRGVLEHFGVPASRALTGGSTGKAFGVLGGMIPARFDQIDLTRRAPAYRGASVGSPATAAMVAASLRLVRSDAGILQRLRLNTRYCKENLARLGFNVGRYDVPILPIEFKTAELAQSAHVMMIESGIYSLLSSYIGATNGGLIRVAIFSDHHQSHLDHLKNVLLDIADRYDLART